MVKQKIKVTNVTGFHLKPAGNLCREAMKFKCSVSFKYGDSVANTKSVLSILGACIKAGDEIILMCDGEDETEALSHLADFIESGKIGE
uniref:HPr family phosphocarrier protein n=1 Tax=Agathobacter sp. TaxID=2021311 RepID=UPI004057B135